ncbi:MAG TPA: TetR/AcrR family transcriptional regulator [Solirubrobacteraceae bacterium]|nr:TetR/AcrR family transcriptional regulator [Solirubrobacteraceae bacterium]
MPRAAPTAAPEAGARHKPDGISARERLLAAALGRFDAEGPLSATLEDIRHDAGVSVGALYHHFPDKAALASSLYAQITREFQGGFLAALRERAGAEAGVKGGVRFYLQWVSTNREAARFLLAGRPDSAALREANRGFFAEVSAWWQTHVHYGTLRELPFDVIHALWLGPAHEFSRHWLAGRARRVPSAVADELAHAAWLTLKEVS